ncbi:hypothetical protein EJ04DRAFT_516189 [Polyplosphaeria fusca]|uniref:C2H2-type domain-containing protein n=1 Tax=Polyplosphaeria fusca TaxID=682080 RepID=A0A9P4QKN4_9PLEO|nr:hypothetical protein EJ04DRAFT_516189 [Polyplosphaeria fusca]
MPCHDIPHLESGGASLVLVPVCLPQEAVHQPLLRPILSSCPPRAFRPPHWPWLEADPLRPSDHLCFVSSSFISEHCDCSSLSVSFNLHFISWHSWSEAPSTTTATPEHSPVTIRVVFSQSNRDPGHTAEGPHDPVTMYHQFNDLPQIEEGPLPLWSNDHFNHFAFPSHDGLRAASLYEGYTDFGEFKDHGMSTMEPMQRYLSGPDPSPYSAGLLQAKLDYSMAHNNQHLRQYQAPYPNADCMLWSPRNDSPDRTSEDSSNSTQNELRSPQPTHPTSCGSPNSSYSPPILAYPSTDHLTGGAFGPELTPVSQVINLRDVEYDHGPPEAAVEEADHGDLKPDFEYDAESVYQKAENSSDSYDGFGEPGRQRDPESVQPVDRNDGDASDSDYKPGSPKTKRRRPSASSNGSGRQKRRGSGRKPSTASDSVTMSRVVKKTRGSTASTSPVKASSAPGAGDPDERPFPCPLATYGCQSTFSSKNEWKRHVGTQHIKQGFWRCDLCATTVDPSDDRTVYHNDFNRKDLFSQHLRRMHGPPSYQSTSTRKKTEEFHVTDDNLPEHHKRCYQTLRTPPQQSSCLFCNRSFSGPNSWDERMEHVGRHLEKDRKSGTISLNPGEWRLDEVLEGYLLDQGLIMHDRNGNWKIGDGKPRRHSDVSTDGESEQDE